MNYFYKDIKCYFIRKKKLTILKEKYIDEQIFSMADEGRINKESIEKLKDLTLLCDINEKSKLAKKVYLLKNIIFFVTCFGVALFAYCYHLEDKRIRLNIQASGVNIKIGDSEQLLISNKLFDDLLIDGDSRKNSINDEECDDVKTTLQSLRVFKNSKVYLKHYFYSKKLILTIVGNENEDYSGSVMFTICKEPFTVNLDSNTTIELNHYHESSVIESPLDLDSINFESQTRAKPKPVSLIQTGELEFYDTSHKKLLNSRDLLYIEGNKKDSLAIYGVWIEDKNISLLIDGSAMKIKSGVSGNSNAMPTIYEWLEGKPAVILILGLAIYLFSFVNRTIGQ